MTPARPGAAPGLCQTARPMPGPRLAVVAAVCAAAVLGLAAGPAGGAVGHPTPSPAVAAASARAGARSSTGASTTGAPSSSLVPSVTEAERERVADPETRRVMDLLTGVLVALAVLVLGITVWFWRSTRPLPASLEALATMSSRRFRRRPPDERDEALDAVHHLKAATDPPPRASDFLRQVRGEDG